MSDPPINVIELHLRVEGVNVTAVDLISGDSGLSRQSVKDAMHKGAVWWTRGKRTDRLRRVSRKLIEGDELHLYYNPNVLAETPTPCQLISDEGDYSVWYKPYGIRSQGSKWGDHCTVYRWAEQHLKPERPAFIVHRLDRAATGLIIVAHKKKVATMLAKLFEGRKIEKRYRAIVHGGFPVGEAERIVDNTIDGREARSRVVGVERRDERSLVEVVIETGRKHQIRRHLSEIGHPVVGDRMYGPGHDLENLQLSAIYLSFVCPLSSDRKRFDLPEALTPHL